MCFHAFPIKCVVEVTPAVVPDSCRSCTDTSENINQIHRFHLGAIYCIQEILIIRFVMFAVMDFFEDSD